VGFERRAYNLSYSTRPFFLWWVFQDSRGLNFISQTCALGLRKWCGSSEQQTPMLSNKDGKMPMIDHSTSATSACLPVPSPGWPGYFMQIIREEVISVTDWQAVRGGRSWPPMKKGGRKVGCWCRGLGSCEVIW
jgi:hypothetical protein